MASRSPLTSATENPLSTRYQPQTDLELIRLSLLGDKDSLSRLIERHQAFIYNVALKMINHVADAEDVTQEIIIKVITNLVTYDAAKGKFTKWLYRLVFNHILNLKKQKYEQVISNFDDFFTAIESTKVVELTDAEEKEMALQIEESKVSCMSGMLMCLDRTQRLTYVIGEIFEIDHHIASEVLEITPDNFRQRLSRARKDLHQWMHRKCGLVNSHNPCRCPKKTKGFIENGWVEKETMKWHSNYRQRINDFSEATVQDALLTVDDLYARLYREHPFKIVMKSRTIMEEIMNDSQLKQFFQLQ